MIRRGFMILGLLVAGVAPARADVTDTWVASLQGATAQMVSAMYYQAGAMGGALDGLAVGRTMTMMQELQAEAYRNYTPGESLCRFGSLSRSLSHSDHARDRATIGFSTMLLQRETGNHHLGPSLPGLEELARLRNLSNLYCNPADNDGNPVACRCDPKKGTCGAGTNLLPARFNRDLDFARLIQIRPTMGVDLSDGTLSPDEQDAWAWMTNLVAFRPVDWPSIAEIDLARNPGIVDGVQDWRGLTASRGVVRQTLARYVGDRAAGGVAVAGPLTAVYEEMGLSSADAEKLIQAGHHPLTTDGQGTAPVAPSYQAQMDVLARTLYQNPNFYVHLVDKPTNVDRTQVALKAAALMQGRDRYESLRQREMALSQLLERAIRDEEKFAQARIAQAVNVGQ